MPYVELHARSAFSFLRGASIPEDLADTAARLGLSGLALCDRDGVFGAPRHYARAKELGTRAFVGSELTMEDGAVLPVLVKTSHGYRNLCTLLSTAKLRAEKGAARITWDDLPDHAAGLIALTGDEEGPLWRAWEQRGVEECGKVMARLQRAFPDNVFVELQRRRQRGEDRRVRAFVDVARQTGSPIVATNGVAFADPQARMVADAFTCLREHCSIDHAGRRLELNSERCLKSPKAMAQLFADLPEAITNTERVAAQLEFTLADLGYRFPDYPTPAGESMDAFLADVVWREAAVRYKGVLPTAVSRQLQHELEVIRRLGFAGYFLIVWDIVRFARDQGTLVQGRGSAANSVVCYALGITAVDPIECKLLFERFLNEGRKDSWPDIDLDLPSGPKREAVIQEVFRKYGKRGAAMTANVITFRGRSTAREMAKILGFGEQHTEAFSRLFAEGDYPQTIGLQEQLEMAGIPPDHPRGAALVKLCKLVYGLPRHLGQHSGGVVIAHGGRLDHVVPLENASMDGRHIIQWDKSDCEDLGIVKIDFLGLGMLAAMEDTIAMCAQRGRPIDLSHIPKDDSATYALLQRADSIGLFQVESRAQIATLPRLKPACFYDVALQVAVIRPGPIQGDAVHPLLDRRAGRKPIAYPDARVKDILERTMGVVLFQEQLLSISMVLAGFSAVEADDLRRAISHARAESKLRLLEEKFRAQLAENKVSADGIEYLVRSLRSFSQYGFPESHALSFALIAYASGYLKVHRTAEFFAGLIRAERPMGFYSVDTLVQDARRHGIRFKPVCVATSEWLTTVESDDVLRLGFHRIKGLNEVATKAMLEQRSARPFASMADYLARTNFSAGDRRRLAAAGALNVFAEHRRAAMWHVEGAVEQGDLFSGVEEESGGTSPLQPMNLMERVAADYDTQSLTPGDHPMRLLRPELPGVARATDLLRLRDGTPVTIAGTVICRQRPGTAQGFVFISLEDETGISNAIVTPALFERLRSVISESPALRIFGTLQNAEGVVHVKASRIERLVIRGGDAPQHQLPSSASHDFH